MSKFVSSIKKFLYQNIYYHLYIEKYLYGRIGKMQKKYLSQLRKRKQVNVVFLPMNIAMWKSQHLYELLKADKRFNVKVVLSPATTFSQKQRLADVEALRAYFDEHQVDYVDCLLEKGEAPVDIRKVTDPDLLFYAQPYTNVVDPKHKFLRFLDRLICYTPYCFMPRNEKDKAFDSPFFNLAWRLYFQTEANKKTTRQVAHNKGRNVVVVGYTSADDYALPASKDVWKVKDRSKKRVIWAPHFTINAGVGFCQLSYFLQMADMMRDIAVEYADRLTFAFKPHPRLYSELCKHPDWGEKKTDEYYSFWRDGANTQLDTGDFVDLFKTSDAMIHDCGSFTFDYLFFNKPVLYDNPNIDGAKETADEVGVGAYDVHYRVETLDDVRKFIDDVVLGGNDVMRDVRTEYYNRYLKAPDGKTVAQNIYDDLVASIWPDSL